MIGRVLGADRLERVEADDQLDRGRAHADRREALEQLSREVEPGGRGGGRAGFACEHRLVPLGVAQPLADVGRQRHLAVPFEQHQRVVVAEQLDPERVTGRRSLTHPYDRHVVSDELLALGELAARSDQRLPDPPVVVTGLQQQHLGRSPGAPPQP